MRDTFDMPLLPGDGSRPEGVDSATRLADAAAERFGAGLAKDKRGIGTPAIRSKASPSRSDRWSLAEHTTAKLS